LARRLLLLLPILLIGAVLLAACSAGGQQNSSVELAPISGLPKEMQDAPAAVRTAYRFAVANPDALRNVPCYCGCGVIGHKSNLACYVKEFGADGPLAGISDKPVFNDHAMGCSICVDIATDVMKMTGKGQSPADIRQQIVATYSKFGPANQ
jgi:hypothetical protein